MNNPFFDKIAALVSMLPVADTIREVERHEDPAHFGNAFCVYETPWFRMRFVNDRSERRCAFEIPGAKEWFELDLLCEVLCKAPPGLDHQTLARTLQESFGDIVTALSPAEYPRTRRRLEEQAQKRRLKTLARLGQRTTDS